MLMSIEWMNEWFFISFHIEKEETGLKAEVQLDEGPAPLYVWQQSTAETLRKMQHLQQSNIGNKMHFQQK